jgi:peptidyl-prolyl cis-trans isomerase SurA
LRVGTLSSFPKSFGFFLVLILIPLIIKSASAKEIIDGVLAVVNGDVITLSDFTKRLPSENANMSPQEEKKILDQMIDQKLLEQEAERLGISVTDSEVDAAIDSIKSRYNLTEEQMQQVMKKENLTPEGFREQWKLQLLSNKIIGTRIRGQIAVTEDEINKYYEENYGETESLEEAKIAHILISFDTTAGEQKAREEAEQVASLAKSGKDFGALAKEYSDDTFSAARGGELGYFKKGDLVQSLEGAVESTPVGGIVGPIESPAGFHVIKVLDKKSAIKSLDEVRQEIKEKIYREKAEKELATWIDEMKRAAYIDLRI